MFPSALLAGFRSIFYRNERHRPPLGFSSESFPRRKVFPCAEEGFIAKTKAEPSRTKDIKGEKRCLKISAYLKQNLPDAR